MKEIADLVKEVSMLISPDHAEKLGYPYKFSMSCTEGMVVTYDLADFDLLNIGARLTAYKHWHSCASYAEKSEIPSKDGLTARMAFACGVGFYHSVDLAPELSMAEFMDVAESAYLALSPVFHHPTDYPSYRAYSRFMKDAEKYYKSHGKRLNDYFCHNGNPSEYHYNGLTENAYKFCCRRLTRMLDVFGDDVWGS